MNTCLWVIDRLAQVKEGRGFTSSASIYNEIRDGLFPRPIRIGERASGWYRHEWQAINQARAAGKSKEQIKALVNKLHSDRVTAGEATTAGV